MGGREAQLMKAEKDINMAGGEMKYHRETELY